MKFLITKIKAAFIILSMMLCVTVTAMAQVPQRPNPPRLVNDLAGVLSTQQIKFLEDSLTRFDRRTSNQVVIVTIADLGGLEPAEMAYEIGEQWGVGNANDNNGVVILVKPKTTVSRGQAFIATGYGLEGALPDAMCKMIVEREMIPHFKQNDYFSGIAAAVKIVCPIVAGEYSKERYKDNDGGLTTGLIVILFGMLLFFIVVLLTRKSGGNDNSHGHSSGSGTFGPGGIFFGFPIGGIGRRGSSGGRFGNGGFGGFGGGSFGGGGAGGSW